MHLLVILLQYLLGRLSKQPQPQPVPIPVRKPNSQAASDRQAFDSTSDPPGRTSIFFGSTELGARHPGQSDSRHRTGLWALAVASATLLGLDHPDHSSSPTPCAAFAAFATGFSPAMCV